MLVLSRFKNQQIIIGSGDSQVIMTIVDIRGTAVRVGFEAPSDVKIYRREVHDSIQRGELPSGGTHQA